MGNITTSINRDPMQGAGNQGPEVHSGDLIELPS